MMNRREFGLLAGAGVASTLIRSARVEATDTAAPFGALLTPMGSERAGNSAGTIPPWTGGYTTIPDGWTPGHAMPDMFSSDRPVVVINAANMANYLDKLSEGVAAMMRRYPDFKIKVFPTRRTAALPQAIYHNIAANHGRAKVDDAGINLGFISGFGGVPFPVPDTSNPLLAGAQVIYNHNNRWQGYASYQETSAYVTNNGSLVLSDRGPLHSDFPYYRKNGSLATYSGINYRVLAQYDGPPNLVGSQTLVWYASDPHARPNIAWQVLSGQGRVRKAPEIQYDTPSSQTDGVCNYDEYYGFGGSLEKYDWKLLGKKEVYIPYNGNAMSLVAANVAHAAHFLNADLVRWELHRVWVVEATLHPGKRNVLVRRRMYVDEDTWMIGIVDAWDGGGNLYKVNYVYNYVRPEVPGTVFMNNTVHNLQTGNYCSCSGSWGEAAHPSIRYVDGFSDSIFNPQGMAASSQY